MTSFFKDPSLSSKTRQGLFLIDKLTQYYKQGDSVDQQMASLNGNSNYLDHYYYFKLDEHAQAEVKKESQARMKSLEKKLSNKKINDKVKMVQKRVEVEIEEQNKIKLKNKFVKMHDKEVEVRGNEEWIKKLKEETTGSETDEE